MKQYLIIFSLIVTSIFGLSSCNDDNNSIRTTVFTLTAENPEDLTDPVVSNLTASFKNLNTGRTVTNSTFNGNSLETELAEGIYHITIEGNVKYTFEEQEMDTKIRGYKESVNITGETASSSMTLFLSQELSDFVIEEIFFTGTTTPEGDQYSGDKYIKIYNNSDTTLYADGLSILYSQFLTVDKQEYTPDIMNKAMAVYAILTIPGSGTDYPVEPGGHIIICDNAIDHREANSNSFDLSKADFEIYYESTNDIDNPDVPNIKTPYDRFIFHNRGSRSLALARIPNIEEYVVKESSIYKYEWTFVFGEYVFPMDGDCIQVPNEYIIDAVNTSIPAEFQWIVTSPSLDMGWTFCGEIDGDQNRYNKSVRRKVLPTTVNGIKKLQDTNNSTLDFEANAVPSFLE